MSIAFKNLKNTIINGIILTEGGYVDDPSDSGGETNFGITVEVARANGYTGEMKAMPVAVAHAIYEKKYWKAVCADDLVALSMPLAEEVVDTGVNMGTARAGEFLQRSLNVLNERQRLYPDIKVDGAIGAKTIDAVHAYFNSGRSPMALLKALNCLQGNFYIELAERREKDERFVYGWLMNRVKIG